jgi:hypothetical protein
VGILFCGSNRHGVSPQRKNTGWASAGCLSQDSFFSVFLVGTEPGGMFLRNVCSLWPYTRPYGLELGIGVRSPLGMLARSYRGRQRQDKPNVGAVAKWGIQCKVWGFHGGDYEECRLLGYKNPVRTSQETHYVSTRESSQLMLCKIWGFHGNDYEECRLLGYKNRIRTSQETHYVSTTESSQLMLCKILRFSRRWLWRMPSSGMLGRVALVRIGEECLLLGFYAVWLL